MSNRLSESRSGPSKGASVITGYFRDVHASDRSPDKTNAFPYFTASGSLRSNGSIVPKEPDPSGFRALLNRIPTRSTEGFTDWRQWLAAILPSPDRRTLLLAIPIGIISGLVASAYRGVLHMELPWMIAPSKQSTDTARILATILVPTVGGLIIAICLKLLANKSSKLHGMPEIIRALTTGDFRSLTWRSMSHAALSLVTIKSGGSSGPEGPIAEIGAIVGVWLGRLSGLRGANVSTLAACGLSAGIAAVFNAPLGGILFALEVVVADMVAASAGPIVLAAVAGAAVSHAFFGADALLVPRDFDATEPAHLKEYFLFILLGLFVGIMSATFLKVVHEAKTWWPDFLKRNYLTPICGGLGVGLMSVWIPDVGGEGYHGITSLFHAVLFNPLFILLAFGKLLSTTMTISSGAPGGAFAPSLVIGAALGAAFGTTLPHMAIRGVVEPTTAYVLAGMGAMLAGVFQAPLTGLVIIFEISGGDGDMILPVLAAIGPAVLISRQFNKGGFYELSLEAQGFFRERLKGMASLSGRDASEFMQPVSACVPEDMTLLDMLERFSESEGEGLLVIDDQGRLRGLITLNELRESLGLASVPTIIVASEIALPVPKTIPESANLLEVLNVLDRSGSEHLLVLKKADWIRHRNETKSRGRKRTMIDATEVVGILSRRDLGQFMWRVQGKQ